MTGLPKNWATLSLDALWDALNHPSRFATPQSVIDAIVYSVRARGVTALEETNIKERLASCDEAAMKQIRDRIERMRGKVVLP